MRDFLAAAALTLALAGAAQAQTGLTVPRPPTGQAADAPVAPDRTADQIDAWLNEPVRGVAPTQEPVEAPPVRDRAIHGEVGAAIGSNGYRSAYGIANMPLGENSDVTVAVAGGHSDGFKTRDGYRWGGGDSKSLAISVRLGSMGGSRGYCSTPRWGVWVPSDYGRVDGACGPAAAPSDTRVRPSIRRQDDLWNSAPAF